MSIRHNLRKIIGNIMDYIKLTLHGCADRLSHRPIETKPASFGIVNEPGIRSSAENLIRCDQFLEIGCAGNGGIRNSRVYRQQKEGMPVIWEQWVRAHNPLVERGKRVRRGVEYVSEDVNR